MQCDPNPANYLYDKDKKVLNLIDFGAGRDYDTSFLGHYLEIIHGAYTSDRKKIIDSSLQMKMLTGEENREMTDTHY
jgi:aarF domain-containing kinase